MGWQKPLRGTQLNKAHPLSKGLVGRWVFNEGSGGLVNDLAGNSNNNIVLTNTTWAADGVFFDSTSDRGRVANPTGLSGFTKGFTCYIKFRTSELGVRQALAQQLHSDAGELGWMFEIYDRAQYQFLFSADGTTQSWELVTHNISNNKIHSVIVTWVPGGKPLLHTDGVQCTSVATTAAVNLIYEPVQPFDIGLSTYNTDRHLLGSIYDVGIWDRALSPLEIALLHREPYCMFQPSFDIGAFEFPVAVGGLKIPVAMHHYNQLRSA